MVIVAQLVRAPDCGSGGRRFETGLSPFYNPLITRGLFFTETSNSTKIIQFFKKAPILRVINVPFKDVVGVANYKISAL